MQVQLLTPYSPALQPQISTSRLDNKGFLNDENSGPGQTHSYLGRDLGMVVWNQRRKATF